MVGNRHRDAGLLRSSAREAASAERLTAEGLRAGPPASPPLLSFIMQAVHGAATFDLGVRAIGLAELQKARSEFGANQAGAEQYAAMALLEYRAALLLGHSAAARTVLGWLTERTGDVAELLLMRAWAEFAGGRHDHARSLIRLVLNDSAHALLPQTVVDSLVVGDVACGRRGRAAGGPPGVADSPGHRRADRRPASVRRGRTQRA